MTIKTSLWRPLAVLVAVAVTGTAFSAGAATHPLSGNGRFNIGSLPIPITFAPAPNGAVLAVSGATVMQTGTHMAGSPIPLVMQPNQLTFMGSGVFPVFPFNPKVFQVGTNLTIQFPNAAATFAATGRTGASAVQWCPGQVVTPTGNPACATNAAGVIPGRMIYTRTSNQFGGPARGTVLGTADVALVGGAPAPCAFGTNTGCVAAFVGANPAPTGVNGGPFNVNVAVSSPPLSPGVFGVTVLAGGTITNAVPLGPGALSNDGVSYGGPWTTGMLTIIQPAAAGGAETFIISGNDGRASGTGAGNLSLVAGALSVRTTSGPNANRGFLNLQISPAGSSIPVMPVAGVAALVALTGMSGAYALRRRSRA